MAFGSSMKETSTGTPDGEKPRRFESQWIDPQRGDNRTGRRVFRMLPVVEDGVMVPGEDDRGVTASEVRFAEFWIPVIDGDRTRQQRVMVDWRYPEMYHNPVWARLYADMPKEKNGKPNPDRKLPKQRFAINVWDRTKVLFGPSGEIVYPNEKDKYFLTIDGKRVEITGTPTPLNKVRVFESSAGKEGGKHVLQQLMNYVGAISHPTDEDEVKLHLHEFDLAVKITGEGTDTVRTIQPGNNFTPITEEMYLAPRYNLEDWAKPWPHDALDALLDSEDFSEVMERFPEIVLFPMLSEPEAYTGETTELSEDEIPF
jgi:hypothetical protein